MMAAAVTFILAIPANNDHWRAEIVKRGGGTWYFDKKGNLGWRWTVPLVSDSGRAASLIIVPRPRRSSDSSRATRLWISHATRLPPQLEAWKAVRRTAPWRQL